MPPPQMAMTTPAVPPASKVNISDSDHGYISGGFQGLPLLLMWKFFFRGHNLWYIDTGLSGH